LVLRPGGEGSVVRVDGRGRFALPAWLRQAAGPSVLVAARGRGEGLVVLVAPSVVIDGVADGLVGEVE
jgi:bifunctional DNA-binding transcriptional regulator/antitoxin component of YhaV-PrlF toxin-antitoxin module